ncbi:ABC transporter ATP-binding protein [Ligilactobacillus sp. WILCCON 0076]|uniref:Putative hemin import ATP-binding protein HrtA n=1 Tax=Ligilactobacillus ubinensis TaxID=2876789 RepID=A0A9X2FJI6_9LACO|nr:ABC transporter ATP-binding protein [Ligilactobacillus ubinensis]MCP0886817.1 ABC transporter ATP-binding protein [Ligilactobacillus ubinensis]
MATIKLTNVTKEFGSNLSKVTALKDVNFIAESGQLILIVGPSGSGKSTFLTIIGNLQKPSSGTVEINNTDIQTLSKKQSDALRLNQIGFILQSYNLVPYLNVYEQFTLANKVKKTGNLSHTELNALLTQLNIENIQHKYPSELSGGQNQRVAIARALYTNPTIILADEPTASLDSVNVSEVGQLFHSISQNKHKTVIVVTHDLRLKKYADKVYNITDGILTLEKNV